MGRSRGDDALLAEQQDYYRARAPEYDEWFLRKGRYDRGEENNRRWFAEVETARRALDAHLCGGSVLELACGTGLWTERLLARAERVTAVDGAPEALARCRERVGDDARVELVHADLFAWRPTRAYDAVFFGFWLSHVPALRFDAFWQGVAAALVPGGRVFFVDSLYDPGSIARDHRLGASSEVTARRRLNDGREFEIVKIFHEPATLERRLRERGFRMRVRGTGRHFLYGAGAWPGPEGERPDGERPDGEREEGRA